MEPLPVTTPPAKKQNLSIGTVISIALILLIIILAALYVWGERISKEGGVAPTEIRVVQ